MEWIKGKVYPTREGGTAEYIGFRKHDMYPNIFLVTVPSDDSYERVECMTDDGKMHFDGLEHEFDIVVPGLVHVYLDKHSPAKNPDGIVFSKKMLSGFGYKLLAIVPWKEGDGLED